MLQREVRHSRKTVKAAIMSSALYLLPSFTNERNANEILN